VRTGRESKSYVNALRYGIMCVMRFKRKDIGTTVMLYFAQLLLAFALAKILPFSLESLGVHQAWRDTGNTAVLYVALPFPVARKYPQPAYELSKYSHRLDQPMLRLLRQREYRYSFSLVGMCLNTVLFVIFLCSFTSRQVRKTLLITTLIVFSLLIFLFVTPEAFF